MAEDKNGNIWFGTEGGGVSKFDGRSFVNYTKIGLPVILSEASLAIGWGYVWFGTDDNGVSCYDGGHLRTIVSLRDYAAIRF